MKREWFIKKDGREIGPISSSQLQELAERSSVTPTSIVKQGVTGKWVPASQIKGLFKTGNPKTTSGDEILDSVIESALSEPYVPVPRTTNECSICGTPVTPPKIECEACTEIRNSSSSLKRTSVRTAETRVTRKLSSSFLAKAVFIALFVIFAFTFTLFYKSTVPTPPTPCEAMQVLIEDVNANLTVDIFEKVKCQGTEITVTVTPSFFSRLDHLAQAVAMQGIHEQWVKECEGTRMYFEMPNGKVFAML